MAAACLPPKSTSRRVCAVWRLIAVTSFYPPPTPTPTPTPLPLKTQTNLCLGPKQIPFGAGALFPLQGRTFSAERPRVWGWTLHMLHLKVRRIILSLIVGVVVIKNGEPWDGDTTKMFEVQGHNRPRRDFTYENNNWLIIQLWVISELLILLLIFTYQIIYQDSFVFFVFFFNFAHIIPISINR